MDSHDRSADGPASSPLRGVRIVLTDDHQVLRGGLRLILDAEPNFEVVGEAGDVESARRCLRRERPDVLLLDLNMPGGSALKAIPDLRAEAPATQIVVLTTQSKSSNVREARRGGARGYVLKEQAAGDLVDAVRTVMAGGMYLSRVAASRISADGTAPAHGTRGRLRPPHIRHATRRASREHRPWTKGNGQRRSRDP